MSVPFRFFPFRFIPASYHFRVCAIGADLGLEPGLNKDQLLEAIDGRVPATGMLMGHCQRTE